MSCELAPTAWICTLEGLFPIMNALMRLQIAFLSKAFITSREVAFEGLLPDVSPFVDLQPSCS